MGLTMKELAKLAEVSQCAVSLVINGKAEGRISKENQERILALIKEHDFRPNFSARGLKNSKVYTVGVIMPTPKSFFDTQIISNLQIRLARKKYMALFSFWQTERSVVDAYNSVLEHDVDGVISWDYHEILRKNDFPVILYQTSREDFDNVAPDFPAAIRKALAYLSGLGHSRIGFVGGTRKSRDLRRESFLHFIGEFGVAADPGWILDAQGLHENGVLAAETLLRRRDMPTAVITLNDNIAVGMMSVFFKAGVKVPEDISILSFDNTEQAGVSIPPLTSFELNTREIVRVLSDRLLERIEHPHLPPETFRIRPELILRESCAKAPSR